MDLRAQRAEFEKNKKIYESAVQTFHGVDGFDVYNTSIPFQWQGKTYIFGRVEKRSEWARSWVRLFAATGKDEWTLVPDSMIYQLEDPYIAFIDDLLVMGGTHVRNKAGAVDTYYGYFYKGTNLADLYYFTTGPDYMKDIRLVQLGDGRIGVFSRPRNAEIIRRYGCESQIGFTIIDDLSGLTPEVIENAPYIPDMFAQAEWGGCNQAYLLDSGLIGVTGHKCYLDKDADGIEQQVYMNFAFVFDPVKHRAIESKIIGTRSCYPAAPAKKPNLLHCCFTSGLVMRPDGRADLFSGLGDTSEGRIVIDYPFSGHGAIVSR